MQNELRFPWTYFLFNNLIYFELTENSNSSLRDEVLSNILANQTENNNYVAKDPVLSRGTNCN